MKILAFESSCDETAAAVVEDGRKILSDVIASQAEMHALYGGVVPEIASRRHVEAIAALTERALAEANCTREDIDAVAVTYAPGLIGAVLVGLSFAKSLAYAWGVPLIPVHHVRGHIAANYLAFPNLEPPFLGLPYPGGKPMDELARQSRGGVYSLPHARVTGAELDMSFSGLKTAVVNLAHHAQQVGETLDRAALARDFTEAVSAELVPRAIRALELTGYRKLAAAGGVAANTIIRAHLQASCDARGCRLYLPPLSLCGDNGAMIGAQGYYEFLAGHTAGMELNACATRSLESPPP